MKLGADVGIKIDDADISMQCIVKICDVFCYKICSCMAIKKNI